MDSNLVIAVANAVEDMATADSSSPAFPVHYQRVINLLDSMAGHATIAKKAIEKYRSDPRKYAPQLKHVRDAFNTMRSVSRGGLKALDDLEKAANAAVSTAATYSTKQLVAWVEEWWDYMSPGMMRSVKRDAKLSTDDREKWNARDWERVLDYYVQKEMDDPSGFQRGRNR